MKMIANDINEFIASVVEIASEAREYCPFPEDVFLFRGQSDEQWSLLPGIARHGTKGLEAERNLIETAKRTLPNHFRSDLPPLDLLALIQHHGMTCVKISDTKVREFTPPSGWLSTQVWFW